MSEYERQRTLRDFEAALRRGPRLAVEPRFKTFREFLANRRNEIIGVREVEEPHQRAIGKLFELDGRPALALELNVAVGLMGQVGEGFNAATHLRPRWVDAGYGPADTVRQDLGAGEVECIVFWADVLAGSPVSWSEKSSNNS